MSKTKNLLAGLLLASGLGLVGVKVTAAETGASALATQAGVASPLAQKATYGRCAYWYRTCRYRWGWGWRFRRCMAAHYC